VALATPHGESAIALIRLSGPQSQELTGKIFNQEDTLPRHAYLGPYRDINGDELDTVVYTYYAEDASYTGEEILEISCHGNPFIVQKIIEDLIQRGCRVAEPGEFTRLAFLNGRMDLSQAEAVMDLIRARSDKALEASKKQLS
jgi:tRNA modification GTPase